MDLTLIGVVIGSFTAGALARVQDVGGRAVDDAYNALKALIERKLGSDRAVQSVEDQPRSEAAQTALAEALVKAGLSADTELERRAEALSAAVTVLAATSGANIEVGNIIGKVNVLVEDLLASGRIKLGDIRAETGDATLRNLTAGVAAVPKKA